MAVGQSWSQSWYGYQSTIYLEGFKCPSGQEYFDSTGRSGSRGRWVHVTHEQVIREIKKRAKNPPEDVIENASEEAAEVFRQGKAEVLPILDVLIDTLTDTNLTSLKNEIEKLEPCLDSHDIIRRQSPTTIMTADMRAFQGGIKTPPHVAYQAWLYSVASQGAYLTTLAEKVRHIQRYLEVKHKMKGKSIARKEGKIAIGHGRSGGWRELKTYLQDRLHLDVDEFNQQSVAGVPNTERLAQMLDDACFAFLIMTAEDEHSDGSQHARENVVHEIGLFQGRLGFKRAIVLLEEGCKEFSNIQGLGQIRFKKGLMAAKYDEIRQVLERESIVK